MLYALFPQGLLPQSQIPQSQIQSLSGLAFMQGILDGTLPAPPIWLLVNVRIATVATGDVRFDGTPK